MKSQPKMAMSTRQGRWENTQSNDPFQASPPRRLSPYRNQGTRKSLGGSEENDFVARAGSDYE